MVQGLKSSEVEELYKTCFTSLVRFLGSRFVPSQDASELAQDAFLKLHAADTSEISSPKSYLFRTAANLAIDFLRKQNRHEASSHTPINDLELVDPAPGLETDFTNKRAYEELCKAALELPPKCQQVFILQKFYGLSHAEIAAEVGISKNTVERHMVKALSFCRKRLSNYYREDLDSPSGGGH